MRSRARRFRMVLFGSGIAALAVTAGACGSSHGTSSNPAPTTGAVAGSGTEVTVGESEFKLAVSTRTFSPGAYTFRAVNDGKIVHSLEITGPGANATTPDLQPGQSADLHVTLQGGNYDLFCPIGSHKALGMNQEITVGPPSAATGVTSSTVPPGGGSGSVSY